jgi:microcystin-dependent protein
MGAVNTTYTFTATDTITSAKMNNIIDETVMTSDAVLGGSGGSGGLDIASGKLSISANAINSSRLASSSVTTDAITNGSVTPAKFSAGGPSWDGPGGDLTISQRAIEIGNGITSSSASYIDFHSVHPLTDHEARIIRGSGANGDFVISNTGTGAVSLQTSSQERMCIAASGNVGVGTATPYGKFTVSNDDQDGVSLYSSGNFSVISLGGFKNSTDGTSRIVYDRTSGLFEIQNGQREDQTGRLTILANGNVGIGKTPTTKLDVNGTVTATGFVGAIPSGAIMAFAMNNAPTGWLAAHGTAVSRTTYSDLFDAISTTYGSGDGSTTFNLPDLRGYFVRGNGTNSDGTASGTFGQKQQDELKAHTHTTPGTMAGGGSLSVAVYSNGLRTDSSSGTGSTGGTETRPNNIAMLYCIKI